MDRSRSICACTSLKAQYTPAGFPSAPRTAADWVRTSTRPPSLVSSANSCTCRPAASMADISRPSTSSASALRTAHPRTRAAHGLGRGPAQDPLGLAVPVGDHPAGVEGTQRGVHAVQQRRQQIGAGRLTGDPGVVGRGPGIRGAPRGPAAGILVRPELVGGPAAPGSTHSAPPAERVPPFPHASPRVLPHVRPFNSNVTQHTSTSPKSFLPPTDSRPLPSFSRHVANAPGPVGPSAAGSSPAAPRCVVTTSPEVHRARPASGRPRTRRRTPSHAPGRPGYLRAPGPVPAPAAPGPAPPRPAPLTRSAPPTLDRKELLHDALPHRPSDGGDHARRLRRARDTGRRRPRARRPAGRPPTLPAVTPRAETATLYDDEEGGNANADDPAIWRDPTTRTTAW